MTKPGVIFMHDDKDLDAFFTINFIGLEDFLFEVSGNLWTVTSSGNRHRRFYAGC